MTAPLLLDQVHGTTPDGTQLLTWQHWSPNVIVVYRNGTQIARRTAPRALITAELAEVRATYRAAHVALNDAGARGKLYALTGTDDTRCSNGECAALLPIGGYRCPECGKSPARYGSGSISGVAHRHEVTIRI